MGEDIGKDALTVETVQDWFHEAFGEIPTHDDAGLLIRDIHECYLTQSQWHPEFKKFRNNSATRKRMERISNALSILAQDIPILQAEHNQFKPKEPSEVLDSLLDAVKTLEPGFRKFKRNRGRRPELWHNVARNLGRQIVKTAGNSGVPSPGLGKPTAPAIAVLEQALIFLDIDVGLDAITDAVRAPRRRILGK